MDLEEWLAEGRLRYAMTEQRASGYSFLIPRSLSASWGASLMPFLCRRPICWRLRCHRSWHGRPGRRRFRLPPLRLTFVRSAVECLLVHSHRFMGLSHLKVIYFVKKKRIKGPSVSIVLGPFISWWTTFEQSSRCENESSVEAGNCSNKKW